MINSKGTYLNEEILTNIYLNCTNIIIQLAVFYKRFEFIWIGADETFNLKLDNKWFGDYPRSLNK